MRFTSISSSIASVLRHVNGFQIAGAAVRTFLNLTHMREHMLLDLGYWRELYQPGFACGRDQLCLSPCGQRMSDKPSGLQRLFGIRPLALCVVPATAASTARLASVRANGQIARSRG